MNRKNWILVVFVSSLGCATSQPLQKDPGFVLPSGEMQKKMVLALRNEMIRLDGEGLLPRKNRNQSFIETTDKLAENALNNRTEIDYYQTFSKLNSTYPNLHAHVTFPKEFQNKVYMPGPLSGDAPNIDLVTEVLSPEKTRVVIAKVKDDPVMDVELNEATLIAVNGRPIREWLDENFLFCKMALRAQCDRSFEMNLLSGVLSWNGGPLVYTISTNGKKQNLTVAFGKDFLGEEFTAGPYKKWRCDWKWEDRYPGFNLIHKGYFACLFEKKNNPSTVLLRISSFQYIRHRERIDPNSPIQSLEQEVAALKPVWIPRSGKVKHLIVDLIDNRGGNEPVPYYKILLKKPFVEQFVEFKKTPEFEDERLRNAAFWDEDGHKLWFDKIVKNGKWAQLKVGEFTEPSPDFCADPAKPCDEATFSPEPHEFRGKVSVMINDRCISSCDGFSWELQHYLNAKLYGFYQAADGAYSRLRLDAISDSAQPDGFKITVNPQHPDFDPKLLVGQDVAISLTTDESGKIFAGNPLPLRKLVPIRLTDYHADVLRTVIADNTIVKKTEPEMPVIKPMEEEEHHGRKKKNSDD